MPEVSSTVVRQRRSRVLRWGQRVCGAMRLIALVLAPGLTASAAATAEETKRLTDRGVGLAAIADWSTQQPFIDVMKTAREWIGHRPGEWGGRNTEELMAEGLLDENGWPLRIPRDLRGIGTLILTDMPEGATSLAGRYRVMFEGDGIVEVSGRAERVRYGPQQVEFDYTPGPGPVLVTINRSDRERTGDYVRNIAVVKLENLDLHAAGKLFNPIWLNRVARFGSFRFMDWMNTNDSVLADWSERPQPEEYTYSVQGVPIEVMVQLANEAGVNPWFNMPHRANDNFVAEFAAYVKTHLDPARVAYVEYSNEVWNWQFQQAVWAAEHAEERWGSENTWMQYYGMRAAEVAEIWKAVFGDTADRRLVTVIATHTGWQGLEQDVLEAPRWAEEDAGNGKPADYFDAYAIAGYFGRVLGTPERADTVRAWLTESRKEAARRAVVDGLAGEDLEIFIAQHKYDLAIATAAKDLRDGAVSGDLSDTIAGLEQTVFPYHANVAALHGLDLIMYEGGTHIVGIQEILDDEPLGEFFIALNYSEEMGQLYRGALNAWAKSGGGLFNAYADVTRPSKWGSWGGLRHLDDETARWDVLTADD